MSLARSPHTRRAVALGAAAVAAVGLGPAAIAPAAKPPKPPNPKPPPGGGGQLSIAPSPNVVVFGRASMVSGQLTGVPSVAGMAVSIDQSAYPFKSFHPLAAGATSGAGTYSFAVMPGSNTRYRATAKTSPPTTSAEIDVLVKKRVTIAMRGSRMSGLVSPAHDGDPVALQRRTSRGYRTVAAGRLVDAGPAHSRYGFTVHRSGIYRARVPADADHLTGTSSPRRIS